MNNNYKSDEPRYVHQEGDEAIENPGKVDEAKWAEAKKAAEKETGAKDKWALTTYIYKKMGGTFG